MCISPQHSNPCSVSSLLVSITTSNVVSMPSTTTSSFSPHIASSSSSSMSILPASLSLTSVPVAPASNAEVLPLPENTAPCYEIAAILDHQFVSTHQGGYYKFLGHWKNHPLSESMWLQAAELQQLHPHVFTAYLHQNLSKSSFLGAPTIDVNQGIIEDNRSMGISNADKEEIEAK
ncbi:hypothetical protein SADUNF_Sadunf17G0081400 [Salix dunnii]|uniref:Chromo domain-containing protein n=1 Tax=Salix dunnii TaxID=1413687 RepID=A0A835J5G8_9ROSI|nr:hypothetical protein SADUNF_Sadunf17G0081400 [Salix dunnii]